MPRQPSERTIVFLVGAVQFVNVLDFVMVMPMGPDFAKALGIPVSNLGTIGGSYTLAAGIAGLLGSLFLDRFDRRKALGIAMAGLVLGTLAGGFATGLHSLMLARVLAGFFGGPATSLAFSIVADVIPAERRGKAMGSVMGAFSIASVLGVPAGLELARHFGWQSPFFAVAALGAVITALSIFLLPPLTLHLQDGKAAATTRYTDLFRRPLVIASYLTTAAAMMAGFSIIPNIATYVQGNLHYPRELMGYVYLAGGIVSWIFMKLVVGRMVDRFGSFRIGAIGATLFIAVLGIGFLVVPSPLPAPGIYMFFTAAMAFRNVSMNTLTSKVPSTAERARFMSIQSAVQHFASAAGAMLSDELLVSRADGGLDGMPKVVAVSMALTAALPVLLFVVERGVLRKSAPAPAIAPQVADAH